MSDGVTEIKSHFLSSVSLMLSDGYSKKDLIKFIKELREK